MPTQLAKAYLIEVKRRSIKRLLLMYVVWALLALWALDSSEAYLDAPKPPS